MVNTSSHAALCYSDARGAGGNSSRRSAPTLDHLWAMGSQVRLYDRSGFGGNDINTALLTSSPFSGLFSAKFFFFLKTCLSTKKCWLGAVNYHFNLKKNKIQRVPELAPYPCMTDTESLKKLIFVKKNAQASRV
jgi:hypothetical protein